MEYATRHLYFPYTHEPLGYNGSKVFFRCFYYFLKFSENFRKIFGDLRKSSKIIGKFPDVIGNVCNGSQELRSFGAGF